MPQPSPVNPQSSMSPSLPPELLQEILALALEDEPPAGRQQTKLAFGAVNRGWRNAVNEWKEMEILDPQQLSKLVDKMARPPAAPDADPVGSLVRSIHLELVGLSCVHVVDQTRRAFAKFFSLAPNVERVEMLVSRYCLVDPAVLDLERDEGYDGHDDEDLVGPVIGPALSRLHKVRHFSLNGPGDYQENPWLSGMWLKRILLDWRALETFCLDECYIGAPKNDRAFDGSIWSHHPNLIAVHLRTFNTYFAIRHSLSHIPPSVKVLDINDDLTYDPPSFALEFIDCLGPSATQLTYLSLGGSDSARFPVHVARGRWAPLLGRMTGLRRLAISFAAVEDLANDLSGLTSLIELEVVQTHVHSDLPLGQYEVLNFLRRAPAKLRLLRLGHGVWTRWTGWQVRLVKRHAEKGGVRLELEAGEGGGEWSDEEWEDTEEEATSGDDSEGQKGEGGA